MLKWGKSFDIPRILTTFAPRKKQIQVINNKKAKKELSAAGMNDTNYSISNMIDDEDGEGDISYEEFEEDKKRGYEDLTCNLDYGTCSYRSKGTLCASLMPYFMLVISINKYMRVLPMPDMPFEAWLLITATLSSSIINFFCLRKDRFKTYFKKFKNKKNILKWHLVCLFYIIGTCISTYYAIMFFNAERFGFKPF